MLKCICTCTDTVHYENQSWIESANTNLDTFNVKSEESLLKSLPPSPLEVAVKTVSCILIIKQKLQSLSIMKIHTDHNFILYFQKCLRYSITFKSVVKAFILFSIQ